jgi:hypothetical protein
MYREVKMLEVKGSLATLARRRRTKRLAAQLGPDPETVLRYLRRCASDFLEQ